MTTEWFAADIHSSSLALDNARALRGQVFNVGKTLYVFQYL
jgi:hypothetical protein